MFVKLVNHIRKVSEYTLNAINEKCQLSLNKQKKPMPTGQKSRGKESLVSSQLHIQYEALNEFWSAVLCVSCNSLRGRTNSRMSCILIRVLFARRQWSPFFRHLNQCHVQLMLLQFLSSRKATWHFRIPSIMLCSRSCCIHIYSLQCF